MKEQEILKEINERLLNDETYKEAIDKQIKMISLSYLNRS